MLICGMWDKLGKCVGLQDFGPLYQVCSLIFGGYECGLMCCVAEGEKCKKMEECGCFREQREECVYVIL